MSVTRLTADELKALNLVPLGKKHGIRAMIETLEVGESLRITRDEFKWRRRTPNIFCRDIQKKTGKKFNLLKEVNKMSWVVQRVE